MDIKEKPSAFRNIRQLGAGHDQTKRKIWIISYLLLAGGGLTIYLLLKLHVFEVFGRYREMLQKISLSFCIAVLILALAKFIEGMAIRRTKVVYTRYNLTRMIRLMSWLLIAGVCISFLFQNWYS